MYNNKNTILYILYKVFNILLHSGFLSKILDSMHNNNNDICLF